MYLYNSGLYINILGRQQNFKWSPSDIEFHPLIFDRENLITMETVMSTN